MSSLRELTCPILDPICPSRPITRSPAVGFLSLFAEWKHMHACFQHAPVEHLRHLETCFQTENKTKQNKQKQVSLFHQPELIQAVWTHRSFVTPMMRFPNVLLNFAPCEPSVTQSPSILSVGQHSVVVRPRSTWSVILKCRTSEALVRSPELDLPFVSNRAVLLLSWCALFVLTGQP